MAARLAWLLLALLIALGAAGVVSSLNHPPGTAARAELTWPADEAARPALEAAEVKLGALSDATDTLGVNARSALTQVGAGDTTALQDSLAAGTIALREAQARQADLETAIDAIPHPGDDWEASLSAGIHDRYQALADTPVLADGLEDQWTLLASRALSATTLAELLARHDRQTAAAAVEGTAGRYGQALDLLRASATATGDARTLRDRLAATTDVSTLSSLLDRNADYDAALGVLYQALIDSNGRVNGTVRAAFEREAQARSQLPADGRAMVVIMADVAQGGLNQAAIAIEDARSALARAVQLQQQLREGAGTQLPG